ncbi:MAG: HlyC/CorC family transporter [Crocinitomicaceae bacterium]|jgi:CBS domain containing-hemolysin-like protein|nr:HlyC/CorC family transporter [Crocinitomicaceae bacterium]
MDPSSLLIIIVVAVLFSAFFSGAEIAFVSANRLKIELDNQKGLLSGKILSKLVKKDSLFITTMLIGNNVALVVYGIWTAEFLEKYIRFITEIDGLVLLLQTIISTLIILLTAEFIPKALFQINPNGLLQFFSLPLLLIYWLFYPISIFTITISNILLRVFKINTKGTNYAFSKIDLDEYVRDLNERRESSGDDDLLNEMQILQNALQFSDIKARDCMVPRTDIIALDLDTHIKDLTQVFIDTGLSKVLIYKETLDDIIGYVHSFELFRKPETIKQILRPISFIPEAMPAKELLALFARQNGNIAVVLDEFGGTSGVITIEDVVEEIFGDIEDEHDRDVLVEKELEQGVYLFSARQDVDYLNEKYNLSLEENAAYETIGGLVLYHLENIPEEGETIELDNSIITVKKVSDRKIEELELRMKNN